VFAINFSERRAGIANKNPRTKIRGKAAGSLPQENRKASSVCQFLKTGLCFNTLGYERDFFQPMIRLWNDTPYMME
jgi:hypothetical protein